MVSTEAGAISTSANKNTMAARTGPPHDLSWAGPFRPGMSWPVCDGRRSLRAEFDNADRVDDAVGRRNGHAALGHELAIQRGGLGPRDSRLHADAHQAVGVIER